MNTSILFPAFDTRLILQSARSCFTFNYSIPRDFHRNHLTWVDSARSGIYLLCSSLKTNDHYKVLVPAFTCCVVLDAVIEAGCIPIIYECSRSNPMGDFQSLTELIDDHVFLLITQSTFGYSSHAIATEFKNSYPNIYILDDRAHGAINILSEPVYPFDALVYSFEQSKAISCCKGGLLSTNLPLDYTILSDSKPLADIRDLIYLFVSYFLLVAFPNTFFILIYKLFYRLLFIVPSMSTKELNLLGLQSNPRKLSIFKQLFLIPQISQLDSLLQQQPKHGLQ